jgi:hypothetical protein
MKTGNIINTPGSTRVLNHDRFPTGTIIKHNGEWGEFVVQWVQEFSGKRKAEVTAVGGCAGRHAWRTFYIDQVKAKPRRRQRLG